MCEMITEHMVDSYTQALFPLPLLLDLLDFCLCLTSLRSVSVPLSGRTFFVFR